ncbi:MAG: DUF2125 domain-containing protein [Rhodovarius sp.]|nr:DUF2125 domain-containing protein [Rhodovarius sp.]MCX7931937.1 DUF2125 domain-containing protein [Rhodovarius sp.]MDW8313795.1 DUF2125 domain-containing protein [Rhodovarius sp.]
MRGLRRLLAALLLLPLLAWLTGSAALALLLPEGWRLIDWPGGFPGYALRSPPGVELRWSPLEPRRLRIGGAAVTWPGHPLGRLASLDAELVLEGPLGLPGSLLSGGGLIGVAARWRDDGGRIVIRDVGLVWGPLRAAGEGELRWVLDGGLLGSFRGRLEGEREAAALFAAAGLIGRREAEIVGLFPEREVQRALFVKDGVLVLGILPLWPLR